MPARRLITQRLARSFTAAIPTPPRYSSAALRQHFTDCADADTPRHTAISSFFSRDFRHAEQAGGHSTPAE